MPEKDDLLKYYIRHSDKRFDELDEKVDKLLSLRWMLIGAAGTVSLVVSAVVKIAEVMASGK